MIAFVFLFILLPFVWLLIAFIQRGAEPKFFNFPTGCSERVMKNGCTRVGFTGNNRHSNIYDSARVAFKADREFGKKIRNCLKRGTARKL